MSEEIEKALDLFRPALLADGGNVELIDVTEDGIVMLLLTGACGHCPRSAQTLKLGIERTLKSRIPWVKQVISV